MKKKFYTSALFAAVAAVGFLGGCNDKECDKCCKEEAAVTSGDANAGEAGCAATCSGAKDAKAGEKSCAPCQGAAKDANAAEKSCSSPCQGAKDANAAEASGCGAKDAKDGKACTKEKSACCGASKCAGSNTGVGTSN